RIESGGVKIDKQWQFIEELLGSALHRMSKPLAGREVTTHVPRELTLVPLDDVLIEQVLLNLLENAEKYTPPASPIEITARQQGEVVVIEVADRGPGLPPGEEEQIFEKFFRGRAAATDGRPGAGLGLAICRAIVAAHGGQIWAENRAGGGATFGFSLSLESEGYRLAEAETGKQALMLAASELPEVVILDLGLPDMDGLEVLRRLREWLAAPVIVLSARGQEKDKVAALDAGADDYLTKPFGVGELLARLRVALRHAARSDGRAKAEPRFTVGE